MVAQRETRSGAYCDIRKPSQPYFFVRSRSLLVIGLAVTAWICAVHWLQEGSSPTSDWPGLALGDLLGGDSDGFARVLEPRPFVFPRDHGPHHEFRSEWWYLTGNLDDEEGRHYGFQLTFFRFGLPPSIPERESAWVARDIYMGHFALTDVSARQMRSFERISRDALGLAGARSEPFKVWIDDWRIESTGSSLFPLSLHASQDGLSLSLSLERAKPVVLQGDRGMSQKSATPGNASYYYSFTRLPLKGKLTLEDGEVRSMTGQAWMDREWSTSALSDEQVGWDWFSIQLDDHTELMFYQLRRRDGSADPNSAGTSVDQQGRASRLAARDVVLEPIEYWTNPRDISYPVRWRLHIPRESLTLELDAYVLDQELDHSVRYWEGAMSVHGMRANRPVAGHGYLEMTGYDESCDTPAC